MKHRPQQPPQAQPSGSGSPSPRSSPRQSSYYAKVKEERSSQGTVEEMLHNIPRVPLVRSVFSEDTDAYTRVVRRRRQQIIDRDIARRVAVLAQNTTSGTTHSYLEVDSGVRDEIRKELQQRWLSIIFAVSFLRVRELTEEARALATLKRLLVPVLLRTRARQRHRARLLLCMKESASEMKVPAHHALKSTVVFRDWPDASIHAALGELVPKAFAAGDDIAKPRCHSDIFFVNSGIVEVVDLSGSVISVKDKYGAVFGGYSVMNAEPSPVGYRAGAKGRVLLWMLPRKVFAILSSKVPKQTLRMNCLSVRQSMLQISHPLRPEALRLTPILALLPDELLHALISVMHPKVFTTDEKIFDYGTTAGFYIIARGTVRVTVTVQPPPRMRRHQLAPTPASPYVEPYHYDAPTADAFLLPKWGAVGASKCLLDSPLDADTAVAMTEVDSYFCSYADAKRIIGCVSMPEGMEEEFSNTSMASNPRRSTISFDALPSASNTIVTATAATTPIPLVKAVTALNAAPHLKRLFHDLQVRNAAWLRGMSTSVISESLRCDPLIGQMPLGVAVALSRVAVPMWYPPGVQVYGNGEMPTKIAVLVSGMCGVVPVTKKQSSFSEDFLGKKPAPPAPTRSLPLPPGTVIGAASLVASVPWDYQINLFPVSNAPVEAFVISSTAFQKAMADVYPNKLERLDALRQMKETALAVVRTEPFCLVD